MGHGLSQNDKEFNCKSKLCFGTRNGISSYKVFPPDLSGVDNEGEITFVGVRPASSAGGSDTYSADIRRR